MDLTDRYVALEKKLAQVQGASEGEGKKGI